MARPSSFRVRNRGAAAMLYAVSFETFHNPHRVTAHPVGASLVGALPPVGAIRESPPPPPSERPL